MAERREVLSLARYGVTGAAGLALNTGLLVAIVEIGGVPETPAAVLSAAVTLAATFALTDRWVFANSSGGSTTSRLWRYYATMVSGKAVNFGIYVVLVGLDVWYPFAWVVGSVVVFFGTFLANRATWRRVET